MSNTAPTRPLPRAMYDTAMFIIEHTDRRVATSLDSQLNVARAAGPLEWFPDLVVDSRRAPPTDLPNGPLPTIPFVRAADGSHVGEILLWVTDGYISGMEFAWITDQAPDAWPSVKDLHFDVPT